MSESEGSTSFESISDESGSDSSPECTEDFKQQCGKEVKRLENLLVAEPENAIFHDGDKVRCPLCPFKEFSRMTHLPSHFQKNHVNATHGTVNMKSVFRIGQARFNFDNIEARLDMLVERERAENQRRRYLQESAQALAEQLRRSHSWAIQEPRLHKVTAHFDDRIILLVDARETRFIFKSDMDIYHRISDRYVCTDRYLSEFLGALIHPETKGSRSRVMAMLRERSGWLGYLLPQNSSIFKSLLEAVLQHPMVLAMESKCRRAADKRVVGNDSTFSVLLSALWQTPHGKAQYGDRIEQGPNLRELMTIQ